VRPGTGQSNATLVTCTLPGRAPYSADILSERQAGLPNTQLLNSVRQSRLDKTLLIQHIISFTINQQLTEL